MNSCCENEWREKTKHHEHERERFIEADYEGPWGEDSKMVMRINLPADISVPQVQLWIAALQGAAPKIMIGENAADMVRL